MLLGPTWRGREEEGGRGGVGLSALAKPAAFAMSARGLEAQSWHSGLRYESLALDRDLLLSLR